MDSPRMETEMRQSLHIETGSQNGDNDMLQMGTPHIETGRQAKKLI